MRFRRFELGLRHLPIRRWTQPSGASAEKEGFPCLFYDCSASLGELRRFVGLPDGTALMRAVTFSRSRLGFAPARPANGRWRVRVVTVHFEPELTRRWGTLVAATPPQCDPAIDAFREFWPRQCEAWTGGRQSLSFEFVDEGVLRFPNADSVVDTLLNPMFAQLRALFPLGPRELLLVALQWPVQSRGGRANGPAGIALFDVGGEDFDRSLLSARHELGHLFGASDLYEFNTGACLYEPSPEIPGPNLYCGCGEDRLARLTARELGWLQMDGGRRGRRGVPDAPGFVVPLRSVIGLTEWPCGNEAPTVIVQPGWR